MLLEAFARVPASARKGWVKADPATIAAAREKAIQSPIYHKLLTLKGWKEASSPVQVKNGTINFKINDSVNVQLTASLLIRYQGPDDHQAQNINVPDEVVSMPLDKAYVAMLQIIYERFKQFGEHYDITSVKGYRPNSNSIHLRYKGISSLNGLRNKSFQYVDVSGNALEDLACENVKTEYLIAIANPLKTLKGMPECEYLNIAQLPTVLDFYEEWKYLPKSLYQLLISTKSSKNIGALFQCPSLRTLQLNVPSGALSRAQYIELNSKLKSILDAQHRTMGMLELQQWLSDSDLEDIISI